MNCEVEITPALQDPPDSRAIFDLARQYQRAAYVLRKGMLQDALACEAPWRHAALHAIELYLSCFLAENGVSGKAIRAMQHDLHRRSTMAKKLGLHLEPTTCRHLQSLSAKREYLVVRYDMGQSVSAEHIICATLHEIAGKVSLSF